MSDSPQDHLPVGCFTRRTQSTRGLVLMVIIYNSKKILRKISKDRMYMVQSPGETRNKLPEVLLVKSHRTCLIPPGISCDNICKMSIREILYWLSAQSFYWGWTCRRFVFVPKFQTQKEHVFNVNYIVWTNSLGTMSHPYWKPSWNLSSQMPAKGLSKDSNQACCFNCFLHWPFEA